MAFVIGEDIEEEIRLSFSSNPQAQIPSDDDAIKILFKQHQKLIIKQLNRKWDILSLVTYNERKIIPRGLREGVIPAEHLHNERFLQKWKQTCIDYGIEVIKLIVEEDKLQLVELQVQIDESLKKLEPFNGKQEFDKYNEILKKEVNKVQRNLKLTKQSKFQRNVEDWEKREIFDLSNSRGRSRSRKSKRGSSRDRSRGGQ